MDFLRRLLGGGGGTSGDPNGIYLYVRPNGCDEVIRIRVNRLNDLSLSDDGKTYWVHKLARGVKCRQSVEMDLYFDSNRRLTNSDLSGGVLVTEADYNAWTAEQNAPQS